MIVYLHGFNGSPQSAKAQYLKRYLDERGRGAEFICPQLPPRPDLALAVVGTEMAPPPQEKITRVGSSLGGFHATWPAGKDNGRGGAVNPAIDPQPGLRALAGPQR